MAGAEGDMAAVAEHSGSVLDRVDGFGIEPRLAPTARSRWSQRRLSISSDASGSDVG